VVERNELKFELATLTDSQSAIFGLVKLCKNP